MGDEHERYAAFRATLAHNPSLDDATIDRYIALAAADVDQTMAQAALVDLLAHRGLSDQQFQRVRNDSRCDTPLLRHIGQRHALLREMRQSEQLSDDFMSCVIGSGDATVQRAVLQRTTLNAGHLTLLRDQGATRAIRNTAKQRLRSFGIFL